MSPSPNIAANNEVLPASLMAAALLAIAVAASTLAAQQPGRSSANQVKQETVVNNADPLVQRAEIEAPIFGLTLEERGKGRAFVAAVEPNSRPWKAGFREGDYLVAVGEVSGQPYDKFLESITSVANETYEGDSFNVTILRDNRRHVIEVPGAGRSPEDLRKLQSKSEKAIEKKLESAPKEGMPIDKYGEMEMASTADIEEYLKLAKLAQEQELSLQDQQRFGRLASVVVGGGWGLGGFGGVGGLADNGVPSGTMTNSPGPNDPTGSNWYRPGENGERTDAFESTAESTGAQAPGTGIGTGDQATPETGIGSGDRAGAATPGSGIGDSQPTNGAQQAMQNPQQAAQRSSQLGAEMMRLQQMQAAGGQLNPAQTQRLAALRQLSQFSAVQNPAQGRMTPEQMQGLQQAYRSGTLNQNQQQTLLQMQQAQLMSEFARTGPGANRNMPNAGAMQRNMINQPGSPMPNGVGVNPGPGVASPGAGLNPGAGIQGTGGVQGAVGGGTGASIGAGAGASGVGVQGAGSGVGDAN